MPSLSPEAFPELMQYYAKELPTAQHRAFVQSPEDIFYLDCEDVRDFAYLWGNSGLFSASKEKYSDPRKQLTISRLERGHALRRYLNAKS